MKKGQLFTELNDQQAEKVVGGVGIGADPGDSAGVNGWGAPPGSGHGLFNAGFKAGHSITAGPNNIIVPGPKGVDP